MLISVYEGSSNQNFKNCIYFFVLYCVVYMYKDSLLFHNMLVIDLDCATSVLINLLTYLIVT